MSETRCELTIDGHSIPPTADLSLRFVEGADASATPVLYRRGRRVVDAWSIQMQHEQPADPWGISGGRDDHEFHARSTAGRTDDA